MRKSEFNTSLDIIDENITPFIPLIFKDLWTLGGNPDAVIKIMTQHVALREDSQIIDLGCGKGATVIELAKTFPGNYTGIDIIPEFIEEGNARIRENRLSGTVVLRQENMCETIAAPGKYDVVIYGHDSDAFGSVTKTLQVLSKKIHENGSIIYETAFHDGRYKGTEYSSEEALYSAIKDSGLRIIARLKWNREYIRRQNEANNRSIKKRIEHLKKQHPDKCRLFDRFYLNQIRESNILDEYVECIAFVLQQR
ncbi:hypothetical protein CR164_03905 [Prosthecochloris marina]|uniref:Methyltransferase domain-containing protein n=1 Tax=Prosthecochloris marina TaxID=2017681 RepID=A0A317TB01_9CHLB|nr:methyltransferase domain-containing protein [Prosthecochloris marina]PWW82891.1 hypothetical protein CR164_03905 [Prosthecochloris marina]